MSRYELVVWVERIASGALIVGVGLIAYGVLGLLSVARRWSAEHVGGMVGGRDRRGGVPGVVGGGDRVHHVEHPE